jgi:hypothetical protein
MPSYVGSLRVPNSSKKLTEFRSESFHGTENIPEFCYASFRGLNIHGVWKSIIEYKKI